MTQTFTEKVQAMTAKEIIMAMVEGLRKPYTVIDMCDYGRKEYGVCFGCAATNAICKIDGGMQRLLPFDNSERIQFDPLVRWFERAINELRLGGIEGYNYFAHENFAEIKAVEGLKLPELTNDYTEEELEAYVKLAEAQ